MRDDEDRLLRERLEGLRSEVDRLEALIGGRDAAPMLVKTKTVGTYPTAAKSYYVVAAVDPGGAEVEGGAGTFADVAGNFFALNAGSAIPPRGRR